MFYQPIQYATRHFASETLYTAIEWTKLSSIVPAFEERIHDWYIDPATKLAADWHNAFSVAALDCLLIDTLAQFDDGAVESSGARFIAYIKDAVPVFKTAFPNPIRRPVYGGRNWPDITIAAEALYYGFRCGILHEAHIPPYAQVLGEANIIRFETGKTTYQNGDPCDTIVLDPMSLLDALKTVFAKYVQDLQTADAQFDNLRLNFKKKFTANYGIDIMGATLT